MVAGADNGISLTLFNDRTSDQMSPPVTISIAAMTSPETMSTVSGPVRGVADGSEILRIVVPAFTTRLMTQGSFVPNRPNQLQILLNVNVDLLQQDTVLISGLAPTATQASSLVLSGTAAVIFGGAAAYATDGTLTFTVTSAKLAANYQHTLSFTLKNVGYAVNSPSMYIRAFGSVSVDVALVDKGPGDSRPLFVAGFTTKTIQQSTVATGMFNTISITFQVNRDFSYETESPIVTIRFVSSENEPARERESRKTAGERGQGHANVPICTAMRISVKM